MEDGAHMSAAGDSVARAVARHESNPTHLLQILREIQEESDWISPEIEREVAEGLGIPVTRVQSVVQFYSFLYDKPRGRYRVLFSDNITDRMLGQHRAVRAHAEAPETAPRRSVDRRLGQRRHDLLHRHVRPGAGAARQQPRLSRGSPPGGSTRSAT